VSTWFRTYGFADVLENLLIGAYPLDGDDVLMLERIGIQRVLNLVEDSEYQDSERAAVQSAYEAAGIREYRLGFVDYGEMPPARLEAGVQTICGWLDDGLRTYVHCRAGWQRSAVLAAGVIAVRDGSNVDDALAYVQTRKPSADPLPHQRDDLQRWWAQRELGRAAER
jgi:protein-tyrosine phosphatase